MTIDVRPDPIMWRITRGDVTVAFGSATSYTEAFGAACQTTNRFINWADVDTDDPAWGIEDLIDQETPMIVDLVGFTITTEPALARP